MLIILISINNSAIIIEIPTLGIISKPYTVYLCNAV